MMEAVGDIKTIVVPISLYKLLVAGDVRGLADFLSRWERIDRDKEFEAWISRLVKKDFRERGSRLVPSSELIETFRFRSGLSEDVRWRLDDLLSNFASKDAVMADILGLSVYSGAAALSFSTRYHRALRALEVPVAEV